LSVTSATRLQKYSQPPYSVSSDFGQLAASRHLISGADCAIAGAATVLAARPTPPAFKKSRRFMRFPPLCADLSTRNSDLECRFFGSLTANIDQVTEARIPIRSRQNLGPRAG
jgi:hypothetical protein